MSKSKSTMHNIYVDASIKFQKKKAVEACFGLYDSHNKFEMSKVIKATDINDAEARGVLEALQYLKGNKYSGRVFTDSQWAYNNLQDLFGEEYELVWIPRELNSKADELAGKYCNYSSKVNITSVVRGNKLITTETKTTKLNIVKGGHKFIIRELKKYPLAHRLALIKKIGESSKANKKVYDALIKGTTSISKRLSSSYIYLIKTLVPEVVIEKDSIYYRNAKPQNNAIIELIRRAK